MRFSTNKQLHINDHLKAHLGYKPCPRPSGTEDLVYEIYEIYLQIKKMYLRVSARTVFIALHVDTDLLFSDVGLESNNCCSRVVQLEYNTKSITRNSLQLTVMCLIGSKVFVCLFFCEILHHLK